MFNGRFCTLLRRLTVVNNYQPYVFQIDSAVREVDCSVRPGLKLDVLCVSLPFVHLEIHRQVFSRVAASFINFGVEILLVPLYPTLVDTNSVNRNLCGVLSRFCLVEITGHDVFFPTELLY